MSRIELPDSLLRKRLGSFNEASVDLTFFLVCVAIKIGFRSILSASEYDTDASPNLVAAPQA